jgi:hypothetical protein
MGAFFESALLFSLAVLIILVGLLIYYFKGRIADIEQKNIKCLDIINDVYKSHLEFKQLVKNEFENLSVPQMRVIGGTNHQAPQQVQVLQSNYQQQVSQSDKRITVEIAEQDSESESDDSDSDDSDLESESDVELEKTKLINVDLSIPENYDLNVDELDVDELDVDELDVDELDVDDSDVDDLDPKEHTDIVVNKLENVAENEIKDSDGITLSVEKDSYKKMNLPALRSFIISKGYQTDSAKLQKMKKGELIDLIVSSQQSDKE